MYLHPAGWKGNGEVLGAWGFSTDNQNIEKF
jgi:hypothetical protein